MNIYEIYKVYMTYFDDFVEALICHHPDVRLLVVAAQQEHFHSNSEKFLELWRCPDKVTVKRSQWNDIHYIHSCDNNTSLLKKM